MLGVFIVILLSLKLAGINRQLLLPSHLRFSVWACLLPLWDKLLINLVTGTISAILYASGNILTGVALANHSLLLLYLGYGVLGGIGLGTGYVTPVSMIIKWFPDKRGLATGLAIMGFGFASLLTSPISYFLITKYDVINTFYLLGVAYFLVMLIVSQFLKFPYYSEQDTNDSHKQLSQGIGAKKALKTVEFYLLWLILFINISCGLALISVVSPMAQDVAGMTANQAAIIVGLMGIFNGFGRLLWASLSDYIGRPLTCTILFVVNILMTISLIFLHAPALFTIAMAVLMTCYGAGFSLIPPYLSDIFGAKELATMHGYILTAWGMAALAGPMLLAVIYSATKSYTSTLVVFILLYLFALAITLCLKSKKENKYLS